MRFISMRLSFKFSLFTDFQVPLEGHLVVVIANPSFFVLLAFGQMEAIRLFFAV